MSDFEPQTTGQEGTSKCQLPHFFDDTYLVPTPDRWILCSKSEGYLDESFALGMVTVVNGALVVKPKGRLAGLCIRDVYDKEGKLLFERGSWYCPVGYVRGELERNFGLVNFPKDYGQTHVNIPGSSWCFMRKASPNDGVDGEEFMQQVDTKVANLPPLFVVQKIYSEQMEYKVPAERHIDNIPEVFLRLFYPPHNQKNLEVQFNPISTDVLPIINKRELELFFNKEIRNVIKFPESNSFYLHKQ